MYNILIINGPNLNMLKFRNSKIYGKIDLDTINQLLVKNFMSHKLSFIQTNSEGEIIDHLQDSISKYDGVVINAASYTHTSIAIRDTIELLPLPVVSVHLSDINKREHFRKTDYLKDVVNAVFMGEKEQSYIKAITYLVALLQQNNV